jgi:hypothetical protein
VILNLPRDAGVKPFARGVDLYPKPGLHTARAVYFLTRTHPVRTELREADDIRVKTRTCRALRGKKNPAACQSAFN